MSLKYDFTVWNKKTNSKVSVDKVCNIECVTIFFDYLFDIVLTCNIFAPSYCSKKFNS